MNGSIGLYRLGFQIKGYMQMRIVTIRDVAREAGVSISTVSRVLNHREEVDPLTREKVDEVIDRLNYVRNANASNLKQRHTGFVAVILRGRRNLFLTDLAERIVALGRQKHMQFLLEFIDDQADEFLAARSLYLERNLQGIIFLGANLHEREAEISSLDLPCVFATVDASPIKSPKAASVAVDNFGAGKEAADILIGMGHKNIALVGYFGQPADSTGQRLYGVLESLREHGIGFDERLFEDCDFTLEKARRCTAGLIDRNIPFTALIAMSDTVAMGAMKALHDKGMRVPEDVSVVGFDGIEQGRYCTPSLATICQPAEEIARITVNLIRDVTSGIPGRHILLRGQWQPGGSVRVL